MQSIFHSGDESTQYRIELYFAPNHQGYQEQRPKDSDARLASGSYRSRLLYFRECAIHTGRGEQ